MTRDEALARAAAARVGRIATVRADGRPHVVPVVFALVRDGETVRAYWAVDHKPKRTDLLVRVQNLARHPDAEVVVDGYDEDWSALWWVRLRGAGRPVEDAAERSRAIGALAEKYPQYRDRPPQGPLIAIDVSRVTWWAASDGA